jgi:hypothetical protein
MGFAMVLGFSPVAAQRLFAWSKKTNQYMPLKDCSPNKKPDLEGEHGPAQVLQSTAAQCGLIGNPGSPGWPMTTLKTLKPSTLKTLNHKQCPSNAPRPVGCGGASPPWRCRGAWPRRPRCVRRCSSSASRSCWYDGRSSSRRRVCDGCTRSIHG